MRTSHSTEMAIDSILYMAQHRAEGPFFVEQIAAELKVSPTYLAKLFQQLAKANILRSHRGARGGYNLDRNAREITLHDILIVFEGSLRFSHYYSDIGNSTHDDNCPVCGRLRQTESRLREVLSAVTVADLLEPLEPSR